MSYCAYITRIKNLHKHPNADRLQIGECFDNSVVVDLNYDNNQMGIYFPTDGQLSKEFAEFNNLLRKKDDNGNNVGGYMDPDKRNVTAVRLRGEKSDGLFMPLNCLDYIKHAPLKEGDTVSILGGVVVCEKYIPINKDINDNIGNRIRKKKAVIAPLFAEHANTEQLAYHLNDFKSGDLVEITLKMHGTSQRTAYIPKFQRYKRTFLDWILRPGTPIYDWDYVTGTRRTVIENYENGFYHSNLFREVHSKAFEGKLQKGESIYYEIVGFTDSGSSIMGQCANKKLNDKNFIQQYGETTTFSYGCVSGLEIDTSAEANQYSELPLLPTSDTYVYRMTMTNGDGHVIEYSPDYMRYRCEQMSVKTVPVFWYGFIDPDQLEDSKMSAGDWIKNHAENFYDGTDPVGKTHIREGVVCRIVNRPKFCAYKHKNFNFKVLEGIIKESATAPDMEEAQDC